MDTAAEPGKSKPEILAAGRAAANGAGASLGDPHASSANRPTDATAATQNRRRDIGAQGLCSFLNSRPKVLVRIGISSINGYTKVARSLDIDR
ncbi:MAG: hypothetical protein Q7J84_04700 [Sulfuricaulis sp.]|nr:hypothetical protein [Sulfuricaulis sp.]